ncbi:MAG: thioredoxin family protein [Firmicutes bacterium]|jgi:small redox-active disulfide protein 2|nr:thioredoxin family protein [Bacillota bacterium]
MKAEVLGRGCPRCHKLAGSIREVASQLSLKVDIVHVTDLNEIVERGVMLTPAVFLDGDKKCEGRVPTESEIRSWLTGGV